MTTISFQFNSHANRKQQNAVLDGVRRMPGVRTAIFVDPDTSHPEISRMCMAEVQDQSTSHAVHSFLVDSKVVDSYDQEPDRHLVE